MESQILYFFLLVLGIPLNLSPDTGHKQGRFRKTLLEKSFEFVPSKEGGIIIFDLSLILLPAEIEFVAEEYSCKKYMFKAYSTSCIQIILTLSTKKVVFYIGTLII